MNRHLIKGVTLIELMVVVVVIAILTGIAYPSYRQYVIRTNRTEAKTELLQRTQALEKCYTRYNKYKDPACTATKGLPLNLEHYKIAADVNNDDYTLTAEPLGGQKADKKCGTLAVDNTGKHYEQTDKPAVAANKCW